MARIENRITHILLAMVLLALLSMIGVLASAVRGGPLDPPLPIGSSMKTLDEIEARTPISQDDIPITINASGSYYLAENLGPYGASAITIAASDVTIDLNGFTMESAGSGQAITIASNQNRAIIYGGIIRNWSIGIRTLSSGFTGTHIHDMVFEGNGLAVELGYHSVLEDCTINGSTSAAVSVFAPALVQRCAFYGNANGVDIAGNGGTVRDNTFSGGTTQLRFPTGGTANVVADNRFNCAAVPAPPAGNFVPFNTNDHTNLCL